MIRSSLSVWKRAFSNVQDLPFCPSDLTLPQYANLTFDEHCHVSTATVLPLQYLTRPSFVWRKMYTTYTGPVVYGVVGNASINSAFNLLKIGPPNDPSPQCRSFVYEYVLQHKIPDAVVIHRLETIFPYIIYPS